VADDSEGDRSVGKVANSFEDATAGALVYVDERGQVRSLAEYRKVGFAHAATAAITWGGLNWILYAALGPPGLAIGALVTAMMAGKAAPWFRLRRAVGLLAAGRIDDAERVLRRLVYASSAPASLRSRALHNLGRIASLRGRYREALAMLEAALEAATGDAQTSRWQLRGVEYGIVVTLVNLDRVADARRRFDSITRMLEGDYLRAVRASAELYVAFAEDQSQFEPALLCERADVALALPSALPLLLLVAWAYERSGQRESAAPLLAAARARSGWSLLRPLYPRLMAWHDSVTARQDR
jgi:tetratricopeptide (TPR) repeat protein